MRVMIATQGTEACEEIFHQLRQIISNPAVLSELIVVTVVDNTAPSMQLLGGAMPSNTTGTEEAQYTLDRARQLLGAMGDKAYFRTLTGSAGPEIVRFAREIGAQLLVVGSRTRHGMDRLVIGSVSAHVVSNAHCSVLVIK
jgi:nucleotide-binding universal stress UspA family protein